MIPTEEILSAFEKMLPIEVTRLASYLYVEETGFLEFSEASVEERLGYYQTAHRVFQFSKRGGTL